MRPKVATPAFGTSSVHLDTIADVNVNTASLNPVPSVFNDGTIFCTVMDGSVPPIVCTCW